MSTLDDYAKDILMFKVGGLPGGGAFYNLRPSEQDANAASAMLLRERFAPEIVNAILDSEEGALARSLTPPGDPRRLPTRTVCFLFLFVDVAEEPQRSLSGFDQRLVNVWPPAGELWRKLKDTLGPAG